MLEYFWQFISSTVFVSLINSAILVTIFSALLKHYFYEKQKLKIAAIILLNQIIELENGLEELKKRYQLNNALIYESGFTLTTNEWNKQKHLLMIGLTECDGRVLTEFYSKAEKIYQAKSDIVASLKNTWESKSKAEQIVFAYEVYNNLGKDVELQNLANRRSQFISYFEQIDSVFTQGTSINILVGALNSIGTISGTTAYDRLDKISKRKIFWIF